MSDAQLLTINAGSSNIKLARFDSELKSIERLTLHHADEVSAWLGKQQAGPVTAVAHRVVHGGSTFKTHCAITPETLEKIRALSTFAPLHQPPAIRLIEAAQKALPNVAHIACFDTVFHHTIGALESHYAIPESYFEQGYRRYGFHGLSYEHVAKHYPKGRIAAAHLGNGASVCAIHDGKSVSTSMGFSTIDGLMMGTRCGHFDAGLALHLLEYGTMDAKQLHTLLYEQSGLLGVSGISADVRELESSASPQAAFALDLFARMAARHIAAMGVAMGGIDALVFTGGIGEHSQSMRARITQNLGWLGNIPAHVLAADEELVMANTARAILHEVG